MKARTSGRREDRPEVILQAAEEVLRRSGARGLTIDAVAAQAQLSKGGVLHHYASKEALIRALVARKVKRLRDGFAAYENEHGPGEAVEALAMVANARRTYGEEEGFPRALMLAAVENADSVADFRAFLAERMTQMRRIENRPGAGAVFVFAIMGMMIGRTLGFHDLSECEAQKVFDALETTARALVEA